MKENEQIRAYLASLAPPDKLQGLSDQDSLFASGLLDSVHVFLLIGHLEKTYGISIVDHDITPENFESIESIARYIGRRLD